MALIALGWLWAPFGAVVAAAVCVASVALADMDLHFAWQAWHLATLPRLFAWQAWHLATSTFTLRGRRGTWRHGPALCVAGVALMALGWLWRRAWFPVDAVVAVVVGVAGEALGNIDFHFAWQARHLVTSTFTLRGRRGAWRHGLTLRGRRGTWGHRFALCVACVALGDIDLHFAWQAWHLATSAVTLRAGVALGDIDRHFVW